MESECVCDSSREAGGGSRSLIGWDTPIFDRNAFHQWPGTWYKMCYARDWAVKNFVVSSQKPSCNVDLPTKKCRERALHNDSAIAEAVYTPVIGVSRQLPSGMNKRGKVAGTWQPREHE